MDTRAVLATRFAARDPARARLSKAVAISAGVVISAATSSLVLHALHANNSLLVMAVFLSMQAGVMVKDNSAVARFGTTALLAPAVALAISVATALSFSRPAVIAAFIITIGGATWLRRFGPRAAAIGSLTFMGFFFTLVMQITLKELPLFCLVAVIAVTAQLLVRGVLLFKRPRREITVLLHEFHLASAAAIHQSLKAEHHSKLRAALARVDEVARAITTWQRNFRTEHVISCDAQTFDADVLDARVNTEEACLAFRSLITAHHALQNAELRHACAQLDAALDAHSSPAKLDQAATWARRVLSISGAGRVPTYWQRQAALTLLAHLKLRAIDTTKPLSSQSPQTHTVANANVDSEAATHTSSRRPAPTTALAAAAPSESASDATKGFAWVPWRQWSATSRMAIQSMVAAFIAAGIGEAISASRWYWAVITVFVVFIGGTTRSGILTKAFRRVIGTAIGIVLGAALILLVGDNTVALVIVCVLAVFGMLYFGPLNYTYTPIFITVMLISLYRMMGILTPTVVELRIEETLAGAVVGVLCAYLILTSSSKPLLVAKVSAYFDALDELLRTAQNALKQTTSSDELSTSLHRLESAQAEADAAVSSMSTAFLVGSPRHDTDAVHSMYVATRAASRLAQAVRASGAPATQGTPRSGALTPAGRRLCSDIITHQVEVVLLASTEAHQSLCVPRSRQSDRPGMQHEQSSVLSALNELPPSHPESVHDAIRALARIHWALEQIINRDPQ